MIDIRNDSPDSGCTKFSMQTKFEILVLNQFRIHQILSFCLAGAR